MGTKRSSKKVMKALVEAGVGTTVEVEVTDGKVTGVVTPGPERLTVNPKNKSAKMSDEDLKTMGQLCLLQGSKKLGETNTKKALCDLLCSGLESGYIGSVTISEYVEPPKMTFRTDPDQIFRHLDYPMNKGGALKVFDKYEYNDLQEELDSGLSTEEENKVLAERLYLYTLDYDSLLIGLARLSLDHPHTYANWINDNADALTGDALVQCACFGDIVYG